MTLRIGTVEMCIYPYLDVVFHAVISLYDVTRDQSEQAVRLSDQ